MVQVLKDKKERDIQLALISGGLSPKRLIEIDGVYVLYDIYDEEKAMEVALKKASERSGVHLSHIERLDKKEKPMGLAS